MRSRRRGWPMTLCGNIFPRAVGRPISAGPIVRAFNRAIRVRAAADLIMDIPTPPPLGTYPESPRSGRVARDAIRDRLSGKLGTGAGLDADQRRVRGGAAGGSRRWTTTWRSRPRMPLVTVAAAIGELELVYPHPVEIDDARR